MRSNLFGMVGLCAVVLSMMTSVSGCGSLERLAVSAGGGSSPAVAVAFTRGDVDAIRAWYRDHGLPPGLARKSELPPGHRRQLARKGTLPPGIAYRSLPDGLVARLSPLPDGHVRILVAGDVVLMNAETRVVVDIIENVGGR